MILFYSFSKKIFTIYLFFKKKNKNYIHAFFFLEMLNLVKIP